MSFEAGVALFLLGLFAIGSVRAQQPLDVIERCYEPYCAAKDDLAFPLKIKSISSDPHKFWRGSKELFFAWAKTHCAEWTRDRSTFVPSHADLHFGNIGVYSTDWNQLKFGMVDFDDACDLPFQIELLQGLINLKLVAQVNRIQLSQDQPRRLLDAMSAGYLAGLESSATTTEQLRHHPLVAELLQRASIPYEHELSALTVEDKFIPIVRGRNGQLKDLFRPAMTRADDFARGLADAILRDPAWAHRSRYHSAAEFRQALLDCAERVHLTAGGSQGLHKYVVLLRRPFNDLPSDAILYFKQQIPSSAQRAGFIADDARTPGQRVASEIDALTEPRPIISSWCTVGSESFSICLKDPWSAPIDSGNLDTFDQLIDAAHLWGIVAGRPHHAADQRQQLIAALNPPLKTELMTKADEYLLQLQADYRDFSADPRVHQFVTAADRALVELAKPSSR